LEGRRSDQALALLEWQNSVNGNQNWGLNARGSPWKLAVTERAALMVTVHVVRETASHPRQPRNTLPKAGVAVRVTTVFQL
jgi:hypothetical protein